MNGVIHKHIPFGLALSRDNILMIIGILLSVYFAYHLIHGNRSIVRLIQTEQKIASQTDLQEELSTERAQLETKVTMMRPGSIDKDLLEERISAVLGYTTADDFIISEQ